MRTFFLIIFLSSWVSFAQAQSESRSLDYYITHAIEYSPAITERRDMADSARLQNKIIDADLNLPSVTATGDYLYAPYSDLWGYDEAITDGGLYSALLNVDYSILNGKKREVRKKAASVSIQQSEYQIEQSKHELNRNVTDQYIAAYQDVMQLQYLNHLLELLNQQKQVLQGMARQGLSNITDVQQIEIEIQDNRIAQKKAERTYESNLMQLNAMCGIADSSNSVRLQQPTFSLDMGGSQKSRFMKQFALDSLEIAALQKNSELKYQPDVSLYGNSGLNAVAFTGIENHFGYSVGLHLSVPIYDGNQRKITRQQTRLKQHTIDAYQNRFKTERNIHIAGIRKQLDQNREQLDLIQQQISQYENLIDNYQQALGQGVISVIDYLTVLRNYADAQQLQVTTLGEQWQLKNELNYWNW